MTKRKKIKMKLSVIIGILLSIPTLATGQRIEYRYDAAGNRILKQILLDKKQAQKSQMPVTDKIAKMGISISPNPTEGVLKIDIPDFDDGDTGNSTVYDLSGKLVLQQAIHQRITTVDISTKANGIYILCIMINGEKSNWKIIKR